MGGCDSGIREMPRHPSVLTRRAASSLVMCSSSRSQRRAAVWAKPVSPAARSTASSSVRPVSSAVDALANFALVGEVGLEDEPEGAARIIDEVEVGLHGGLHAQLVVGRRSQRSLDGGDELVG